MTGHGSIIARFPGPPKFVNRCAGQHVVAHFPELVSQPGFNKNSPCLLVGRLPSPRGIDKFAQHSADPLLRTPNAPPGMLMSRPLLKTDLIYSAKSVHGVYLCYLLISSYNAYQYVFPDLPC